MKRIRKQRPPAQLIAWLRAKTGDKTSYPTAWNYDDMPADVRSAIKGSLLQEQGGLCCYTGRRISFELSHIEHLKPQRCCVNHEDTDYANLLAAHPAWNAPKKCEYGAHAKADWFEEYLFVHPLRNDCEIRIQYKLNGKVSSANPTDQGAKETIDRLNLDHCELREMRERAIYEALFEKQLTKTQVRRLMETIEQPDSNGLFRPFCFVIKQACAKYLKRFDVSQ